VPLLATKAAVEHAFCGRPGKILRGLSACWRWLRMRYDFFQRVNNRLRWYHSGMRPSQGDRRRLAPFWRAMIEVAFIVFLFYSNLLMGEFTASNRPGKSLFFALKDIFTGTNFAIAVICALIGYVVFEQFRKRL
jgi:hypothetical protein